MIGKTLRSGDPKGTRPDLSKYFLMAVALSAVAIIFLIIIFITGNSAKAISSIGIIDFLTGDVWNPAKDTYGALPLITGTLLVTAGAILFALPLGLGSAILLSEVVPDRVRNILKPICEVFAGIPSVVYGFFGLVVLVPFLLDLFPEHLTYGSSWLAGSILLGIMALPTIISVSDDAMRSVPRSYREASVAVGATRWETTRRVVLPAAISGITAATILGIGRAIGETMAVMMVTGNAAIIPEPLWNVFSLVRTITSTLALEMGEVVVGSVHYSALFLLALVLMAIVFAINIGAKMIVKRTRRRFEEGGAGLSDRLPENARNAVKRSKKPVVLTVLFIFITMMASLFVSVAVSALTAFAVIAFIAAMPVMSRYIRPISRERIAHSVLMGCIVIVVAILAVILGDIVVKGLPALSIDFLTQFPSDSGRAGGIMPAILGTLQLIVGTAVIALPLGVFSGIYLAEYSGNTKITRVIRSAIDLLNGTPSIVFGLFGLTFIVVYLGWGVSLIAGCFTLAFLIMPVIIRTTEEAVTAVPQELREASMAMGATKWQTSMKVVLPAALGGVLTGVILSLGRAAGETAPVMFTAVIVSQRTLHFSLFDPVMALPYHLYYLAAEVPGSSLNQYGTALVLMIIVMAMFLAASLIRHYYSKKVRW